MGPGVGQRNRHGGIALRPRRAQIGQDFGFVQRRHGMAVAVDPPAHFQHALVQRSGLADRQVEQVGTGLVADRQQIGKAAIHHQQRARALAFEQGVGGHGRAHLHFIDRPGRPGFVGAQAQDLADAGNRGIGIALQVFAQQLGRGKPSLGRARDNVGERAATIDPEPPSAHAAHPH
jgi:hypothetical protein